MGKVVAVVCMGATPTEKAERASKLIFTKMTAIF
jgi:hypothetical protein